MMAQRRPFCNALFLQQDLRVVSMSAASLDVVRSLSPARAQTARVSFVVLSYNSAPYLETCVRSLVEQASGALDEIWIVDNGSTDGSPRIIEQLRARWPDAVKPILLEQNTGTTVSRNMALERARGRYIGIIDSDVEVPPGTVDALIARLDADPRCGIVAPRLVYPDGRPQLSTDVFPTVARKIQRFVGLRRLEFQESRKGMPSSPRTADYAISAFWLMRRDVLEKTGFLDSRIFYSPEDVDFCLRIWQAGYMVVYDPGPYAIHRAQEISRKSVRHWATWSHIAGLLYLFRKHRYFLGRGGLYRRIGRFSH